MPLASCRFVPTPHRTWSQLRRRNRPRYLVTSSRGAMVAGSWTAPSAKYMRENGWSGRCDCLIAQERDRLIGQIFGDVVGPSLRRPGRQDVMVQNVGQSPDRTWSVAPEFEDRSSPGRQPRCDSANGRRDPPVRWTQRRTSDATCRSCRWPYPLPIRMDRPPAWPSVLRRPTPACW